MNTELGKIEAIRFGFGGYQDAQFGVSVTLSGPGWGVQDFRGHWNREPDKNCKWTKEQQNQSFLDVLWDIRKWLAEAKVDSLDKLKGKPVEVTFENGSLQTWRILTEVL